MSVNQQNTKSQKVLIFIVSYNHQLTITKVLERIPQTLFTHENYSTEILIIDDCSPDSTFETGYEFLKSYQSCPVTILKNPKNLGYGGNQKVGYRYAIENKFDHVVLLHGDGQYAPEVLPTLIEPLIAGAADAVYGSRMLTPGDALKGGMPRYKFYGNKILTRVENYIAEAQLSEWHSGLRLYSVKALMQVPFEHNSDYYDFDTDIILQFTGAGLRIKEIAIPTHYGDEECNVDGLKYARKIITSCLLYRVQRWGIFYHPRFDFTPQNDRYQAKLGYKSSHSEAIEFVEEQDRVLAITENIPSVLDAIAKKSATLVKLTPTADLEDKIRNLDTQFDKVLLLDSLEVCRSPEKLLSMLRQSHSTRDARFYITTGNVGFLPIRLMLFAGAFNYGVRGILDKNKARLFTLSSLNNLLSRLGFSVERIDGLPAPYPLALKNTSLAQTLLWLNTATIKISRRVFGYQLALYAEPKPTVDALLERAISNTAKQIQRLSKE